jgi:hypothetical protein
MNCLKRICWFSFLFLFTLAGHAVAATNDGDAWSPTPPRLSFIDGEVSYWRAGAEDWARARPNLALAEGDALYAGRDANFEVQFGSRSYIRADEDSQLSLLELAEHRIQFKLTSGLVSFDMRSLVVGDSVEVSTPDAVFVIKNPGYYRVEVNNQDTHFITRRGGEATVITADGRTLSIYPSEDIVVTSGRPVKVATYAAPAPDAWDRWNDARSDRSGESISARYLPPGVYGAEELDHYGRWRVVPSYGSVWIPHDVGADWVPYSTGSWVWDPYYEWTWVDDAPWGWAPFHYGRWVYIDGFWAWAPGPVVRRPVYSPALVAFMVRGHDVSVRVSVGLPGLWWVALSWGEPVLPWWGVPRYRGHPYWGGWGGPRIVNNVVIRQTTVIKVGDIHYHNARLPRAILTVPADKFGREPVRATVENRYRHTDFAPVRGELPVKPARVSLSGGAPKGVQPPREILTRPVVSIRAPREREQAQPWKDEAPRVRTQARPETRYVIPPVRRSEETRTMSRPPFGAEAGPERDPLPPSPRYGEVKKSVPPPVSQRSQAEARERETVRSQTATREPVTERREARPVARPAPPATVTPPTGRSPASGDAPPQRATRSEAAPQRGENRQDGKERSLPGQPASQTYKGRDRERRDAR